MTIEEPTLGDRNKLPWISHLIVSGLLAHGVKFLELMFGDVCASIRPEQVRLPRHDERSNRAGSILSLLACFLVYLAWLIDFFHTIPSHCFRIFTRVFLRCFAHLRSRAADSRSPGGVSPLPHSAAVCDLWVFFLLSDRLLLMPGHGVKEVRFPLFFCDFQ